MITGMASLMQCTAPSGFRRSFLMGGELLVLIGAFGPLVVVWIQTLRWESEKARLCSR